MWRISEWENQNIKKKRNQEYEKPTKKNFPVVKTQDWKKQKKKFSGKINNKETLQNNALNW